jgi:hypothetical protein
VAICLGIPLFLLIAWIGIVAKLPAPPLVISEKTTRITGPLTDDGYIDFLKALEQRYYPPELATDDNGFRMFVQQFGDKNVYEKNVSQEDREFYRLQIYEKLGLDSDNPPTLTLPVPPCIIIEGFKYDQPWTLEDYPMLADWVNEMDEPLDAIAEAIRKPVFFPPLLQSPESVESGLPQCLIELIQPDVSLFRNIARNFTARATYRIGQGDIDGAINDKLTLHRLGRLTAQRGFMVNHLVGIAIEGIAIAIPIGANPEYPFTKEQVQRVFAGLDTLPQRRAFRDTLEWDRYFSLSCVQVTQIGIDQHQNPLGEFSILRNLPTRRTFNWNIVYRRMNEVHDAVQEPPPRAKLGAILDAEDRMQATPWNVFVMAVTPGGRERIFANMLIALALPATNATEEALRRSECQEIFQRLTLAILFYQLETGAMPDENWVTQITPYLAGTPLSCPSNPSPPGETTYALVQYGDAIPGSLLLVELTEPVPFDKAIVTADEVLARQRTGNSHSGGMNTAYRNGSVRFLSSNTEEAEWLRLLGRE